VETELTNCTLIFSSLKIVLLCFASESKLLILFFPRTNYSIFAYGKGLFRCDVLANYSKNVLKSESSGGCFWKQLSVQRKRSGQHQLFVNWEGSNTRFSDGSVGL
jgi:hypothetical protein